MNVPANSTPLSTELHFLSGIVLAGDCRPALTYLTHASEQSRAAFCRAAHLHHVTVRSFRPLAEAASASGDSELAVWAREVLSQEESRIANVLNYGEAVCRVLEEAGYPVLVIKSLDHWPDIGNDLDLYTSASKGAVRSLLERRFRAVSGPRTWGDRLAEKCGYRITGLRSTIEVHHGRLGQTGEHRALAERFLSRRVPASFLSYAFMVPAPEERVIAATLQRMYRHFYFRICDVANTAGLIERDELDFAELHAAASSAGILAGVSSYLRIVAGYLRKYARRNLHLPPSITDQALFDREVWFVRGPWLRIPVLATAPALYARQMAATFRHGDLRATFRLSLLPPLASAAKLTYLMTGNHHGIW